MGNIGRSAWLIVLAAILPLALFAILQLGFSAREQRRTVEAKALSRSEAIILAADARYERIAAGVDALATSVAVKNLDAASFGSRAAELAAFSGDWRGAQLLDRKNGRRIAGFGIEPSALVVANPPGNERTRFVGYSHGNGCRCLVFERRAARGGQYVVQVLTPAEPFERLLPSTRSDYPVSAIAGPRGRFVARSVDADKRFGQPGSSYFRAAVNAGKPQGIYRGYTLEGFENYTAFTRSAITGWSAHVALGSDFVDDPAQRFLLSLGAAALLSLLLAGLLIAFAMRQMAEARRFAERMQQAQKMEALGQLTGGIAHDFNNLLTPVIGALDFIRKSEGLDGRSRRLAEGAMTSAVRAGKLTSQLLAFSRKQKLQVAAVDLERTAIHLRDLVDQGVGSTHRVTIERDPRAICAMTDANQLEVALLNLIINARDASPAGSLIEVRMRRTQDDSSVVIEVEDKGTGMSPDLQSKALEPFFTTKEPGRGTGLGLAQVFGVVTQSNGNLEIVSEPGAGTLVRMSFTACDVVPAALSVDDGTFAEAGGRKEPLRLLVVDDDPAARSAIAGPLQETGYHVESVASGKVALSAIEANDYDLIVTDYAMPDMTGAELIQRALAVRPDLRCLVVTGYSDSEAVNRACPDNAVLSKPFTPEELLAAVAKSSG